jgi:hypothetical protein
MPAEWCPRHMSLFLISTSGRCATAALCNALDNYSDHCVRHEPAPLLLEEAYLKHVGKPYCSRQFRRRLRGIANARGGLRALLSGHQSYGQSWRAPNLLPDIAAVAPHVRVLVIIRKPADYVLSSYRKGAFRGEVSAYDKYRLLPPGAETLPVALRIAAHWNQINGYMLDFAAAHPHAGVMKYKPMAPVLDSIADFLGISMTDRAGALAYLETRPNASPVDVVPDGFDKKAIAEMTASTWDRVRSIPDFDRPHMRTGQS